MHVHCLSVHSVHVYVIFTPDRWIYTHVAAASTLSLCWTASLGVFSSLIVSQVLTGIVRIHYTGKKNNGALGCMTVTVRLIAFVTIEPGCGDGGSNESEGGCESKYYGTVHYGQQV